MYGRKWDDEDDYVIYKRKHVASNHSRRVSLFHTFHGYIEPIRFSAPYRISQLNLRQVSMSFHQNPNVTATNENY